MVDSDEAKPLVRMQGYAAHITCREIRVHTFVKEKEKHMSFEMSRRSFVAAATTASIAAASAASIARATESTTADAQAASSNEKLSADKAVDCDVVVVGAGGAGMSAATRAASIGLDTVILEKASSTGGTTLFTEGLFAVNSHIQLENGKNPDVADLYKRTMEYHHWLIDGHAFRQYVNQSGSDISWMESLGIVFSGTGTMCDNTYNTWHQYQYEEGKLSGANYVDQWTHAVENAGATLVLNSDAQQLVTDDTGAVTGVIAKEGDEYVEYDAKVGVILASGGYSDNPEMIVELSGVKEGRIQPMGSGTRTGFGITAARKVGAALAKAPGTLVYYGGCLPNVPYGNHLYCISAFQPLFWVNQNGRRFVNEDYAERNFSFSGSAQSMQDAVFSILTQSQIDDMVENGGIYGCGEYIHAGDPLDQFWDQYNEQVDAGNEAIQKADTLDELAEKIGLEADALKAEIERYNGFCEKGVDEDFGKDPDHLRPLEEGPYYSFALNVGIFATVGGLKINEDSQVLDTNDEVIPGLWAAGCEVGGLYGDAYDVSICEGSCQGYAVYTGRRAAESAATMAGLEFDSILEDGVEA